MARYIKANLRLRNELKKEFGLSRNGINDALNFRSFSERAERIRKTALAAGGEIVESAFCPECRTQHTNTQIIQTFANGVVLVIDKRDSTAMLRRGNTVLDTYANVTIKVWGDLIARASNIANDEQA